ncbi:MarR family transcriptional regulator for hemolysin [Rhizomicrobium palustre]|uniref:MarR family transcriptional regulator for hemolysin n=1 Tax=Rhizomicrobium palustre TaxID=189966 RepID=A0A846MYZ8_9PROT|nr:MarR family transcriptional regulator [Rhizomicrobium palustre]NIK88874.1 MarR family transcriptional regulator for hemolysin [Rhizomicrobium palustre]
MDSVKQSKREFVFRMMSLSKAYRRYANEELERSGLSHSTAMVVMLLSETRAECSQKFLADHLDVAPASMVPLLKQIEAAGLITRRQDAEDKRVNNIELTPAGVTLAKEARRVLDGVRQRLFVGIDPADVEASLRVLEGLQSALAAQKPRVK